MPYLNLDLDYFTHPKVLALEDVLGEVAVMYPVKLWCYAGKHFAQTGILTSCTKLSIEKALGWSGEPGKLVDALVKISFIDVKKSETESENFTYRIHDWKHHAGHLGAFKRRAITAAKTRWQKYASSKRQADDKQALAYALGSSSPSSSSPVMKEKTKTSTRVNGGVIPDDWDVKDYHERFAAARGLDLKIESAHFRGRALELEWTAKDWDRKFSNWMLQEVKFRQQRSAR